MADTPYWQTDDRFKKYTDKAGGLRADLLDAQKLNDPTQITAENAGDYVQEFQNRQSARDRGWQHGFGDQAFVDWSNQNPINQAPIDQTNVGALVGGQINDPRLPAGATQESQMMQAQSGETLDANSFQVDPSALNIDPAEKQAATESQGDAGAASSDSLQSGDLTYDASVVDPNANAGVVAANQTMQGQLDEMMDFDPGVGYPDWAKGAVRAAMAEMNAKGITSSTMMGEVMGQAMFTAAMPIAQHDAQVYERMNMTNIANRQAFLMSNQAAENASFQFNSKSTAATTKFMDSIRETQKQFNAKQIDGMKKFNVQAKLETDTFNAELSNAREQFNVNNRMAIEQGNANWRRQINTANTAAKNADIQTNAQNILGVSNWAMASLWQEQRDNASWAQQSSENDKTRAHNMAVAALNRKTIMDQIDEEASQRMYEALGGFAINLFDEVVT